MIECTVCGRFVGDSAGESDAKELALHIAEYHVEYVLVEEIAGENWYSRADPRYIGDASSCAELANCPAPHDGWVTLGDANQRYDQAAGRTSHVRVEWVRGRVIIVVDAETWTVTRPTPP